MGFKVGETVVYPRHGACTVKEVKQRVFKGEEREFLVLTLNAGGMQIEVPAGNVEYVGIRGVTSHKELEVVFDVLRAPYVEEPTNWSRRFKSNQEKISSGDVLKIAEVVRDLYRRNEEKALSAAEKVMFAKSLDKLAEEVALSRDTDKESANALLLEVLASGM
jgi:CarD family transcriptional regulator